MTVPAADYWAAVGRALSDMRALWWTPRGAYRVTAVAPVDVAVGRLRLSEGVEVSLSDPDEGTHA